MADVLLDFPIRAPAARVFAAVSTPAGLDQWWSEGSTGQPAIGEVYALSFGPGFDWRARVTECHPPRRFELELIEADADWLGTRVGFSLSGDGDVTSLRFHHVNWPQANDHYRTSCYCWAMYLRVLRRYLEFGEAVPYDRRLDV